MKKLIVVLLAATLALALLPGNAVALAAKDGLSAWQAADAADAAGGAAGEGTDSEPGDAAGEPAAGDGEPAADETEAAGGEDAPDAAGKLPAAGLEAAEETPPARLDTPLAAGSYIIRPAVSLSRFLDVAGGSSASGANIQLYQHNMTPAQSFTLSFDDETGYYTITNDGSGKVLDVAYGNAVHGANIWQYTANGTKAQQWEIVADDARPGAYILRSALSSEGSPRVADVAYAQDANGANLQVYGQNGTAAQAFYFLAADYAHPSEQTVPDGVYAISPASASGLAMDVPYASFDSSVQMQIYSANNSLAQRFEVKWTNGYYSIRSMVSGLALDCRYGLKAAGTALQQYVPNGSNAQMWAIASNDDGSFSIFAKPSGLAIDVCWGSLKSGSKLQLYTPNGSAAQRFSLTEAEATPLQDGVYAITPRTNTAFRADVAYGSTAEGANIQAYQSNNTPAQRFELLGVGNGLYALRSVASGRYMRDTGATAVQTSLGPAIASRSDELWSLAQVPGGWVATNHGTGRTLTTSGTDIATAPLQLSAVGTVDTTQLFLISQADIVIANYNIIYTQGGNALEVSGGSRAAGAAIRINSKNNSNAQKFSLTHMGASAHRITNAYSKRVLDITYGADAPGTGIQQYSDNGSNAQRFTIVPTGDGWYMLKTHAGNYLTAGTLDGTSATDAPGAAVCVGADRIQALRVRFEQTTYQPSAAEQAATARQALSQAGYGHWLTNIGNAQISSWRLAEVQNAIGNITWNGNDVGFVMVSMDTGQGLAYNADAWFYSASTLKGPYVASLAAQTNALYQYPWQMQATISISDNNTYATLRNAYGAWPIANWAAASGVAYDRVAPNYVWYSATDLGRLWTKNHEFFHSGAAGLQVSNWYRSPNRSAIAEALGGYRTTYSKAGWYPAGMFSSTNDAGIVYIDGSPYLVVILTNCPVQFDRLYPLVWALDGVASEL